MRLSAVFCAIACCFLIACGDKLPSLPGDGNDAGEALDAKAVQAGILPDPDKTGLAGRYETRSDLGIDKFCAVKTADSAFDVGFLSVSGAQSKCEGTGTATWKGEDVDIILKGQGDCRFTARYDGVELRFPAAIDSNCTQYCSDKASFSGTHYFMIEPGNAAARNTLGRKIDKLCR